MWTITERNWRESFANELFFREVPSKEIRNGCVRTLFCPNGVCLLPIFFGTHRPLKARAVFPVLLQQICPGRRAITENVKGRRIGQQPASLLYKVSRKTTKINFYKERGISNA